MTTPQQTGQPAGPRPPHPRAWSYGPGGWYAVLGRDAAVVLPPGERTRVPALWAAVDDGAGFDALLDALLADGLRGLAGFVLVAVDGDAVRVLARGEAAVSCETDGGTVVLDGRDAATWSERRLVGVRSTRVVLDGAHPGSDAPSARVVGTALVRASWVAHPAVSASSGGPAGGAQPITEPEPGPEPEPEPDPEPGPDPESELVARLVLSTGAVVEVDRVVLVGRDPEASRPGVDPVRRPGREPGEPRLVRVPSPQHEISSTHVEVRPGSGADQGAAVVTDLGSTNGTVLLQPGLPQQDLQPWAPVGLVPGSVLDLGDGVTLQVAGP